MFEFMQLDDDERGQVGIGTLIIFIAMVLVAAIAAGVLINTAGLLQSQASNTGSETQEAVANQIDVVHAYGVVYEHTDPTEDNLNGSFVEELNFTIKKSAGSNEIDLTSMTVQYTSDHEDVTLTYNDTEADASNFTTSGVGDYESDSLTNSEERVILTINASLIEDGVDGNGERGGDHQVGLSTGADATVQLVDQSGAKYTYGVSVPNTFGDKEVVEV